MEASIFFGDRWCALCLNVVFDEQIKIADRYMVEWNINRFGLPFYKASVPLDAEATEIGNLLGIPINIISYVDLRKTLNSIYIYLMIRWLL